MKLNRKQLRKIILEEAAKSRIVEASEGVGGIKALFNYFAQKGIKHSPYGIAMIMSTYGDEIVTALERDGIEKAAEKFLELYSHL
jgi:hypothetical protein